MKKILSSVLALALISGNMYCNPASAFTVSDDFIFGLEKTELNSAAIRSYEDADRDIHVYAGKDSNDRNIAVKSVSYSSGIRITIDSEKNTKEDALAIIEKYINIDQADEYQVNAFETHRPDMYSDNEADKTYIQITINELDSENTITEDIANKIYYDFMINDYALSECRYIPAHNLNQVLTYNLYNESDEIKKIAGWYKTDDFEILKECISNNNINCNIFIAEDNGEYLSDYRTIVTFDDAEFTDILNGFSIIYDKTGIYTLYGVEETLNQEIDTIDLLKEDSTPGDINSDGKVDLTDLSELSLAIIGDKTLTESQIKAADIDKNGKADLPDLARLRQYLSKVVTSLR